MVDRSRAALSRRRFLTTSAQVAGAVAGTGTLSSFLSACGEGNTSGNGPSTLTVLWTANPAPLTKSAIQGFEHANNCTIKYFDYSPTLLNAMLAAGKAPDFVRVDGSTDMPYLISRGLAENLDPYFSKSDVLKPSDLDPVNDIFRFDGKTQGQGSRYGMAINWSQDAMLWYNKTLFDRAKVPYLSETTPIDYDALLELAKRLTVREGGRIKVYGLDAEWGWNMQLHLIQMIAQQGGSLWNADFTKCDFTTPQARRALQWYVDYAQAHVGPSPLDPIGNDWSGPLYTSGRLAMVMFGYWFHSVINGFQQGESTQSLLDNSGFVPAPQMGTKRIDACMAATGAWIPQTSKQKSLAFKYMEWYFGGQPQHEAMVQGSGLPPLKSLYSLLPHTKAPDQQTLQVQQTNLKYQQILGVSPYTDSTAMESAIVSNLTPVLQGQVSLDVAIGLLQNQVNDLIRRGRELLGK